MLGGGGGLRRGGRGTYAETGANPGAERTARASAGVMAGTRLAQCPPGLY